MTPWTAACQAFLSITNSWSLLKLMSFKLVMPSNHLILCCPLFLLPSIFPSIRVFSNESVLYIRWPKYYLQQTIKSAGKELPTIQEESLIPELGSSPGEGIGYPLQYCWASPMAQMVKNPPAMQDTWVWSLGWEDLLEEGMGNPLQCSYLENPHGQRSLVGPYSPHLISFLS